MSTILEKNSSQKRRVAIYIRVSTAEQKMDGYSPEAQKKKLKEYVKNNPALELVTKDDWIYEDTHTGSDMNRTELQRLLKDVKGGKFDAVLVWKIDRLSRSLKHLLNLFEEFQASKVSFISLQENIDFRGAIGSLIFQIFGAIAQFERELIKGRTQMGKIASAELGNWTGTNIPFGYDKIPNKGGKGSRLIINSKEKEWVQRIYEWYIYEELGHLKISKRLNELKVPKRNHLQTSRAKVKWTSVMVKTIIHNPLYRGMHTANTKDEEGDVLPEEQWTIVTIPPCVSEFTFQQAQLAKENRNGGATGTDYLLSGKLVDMDLDKPKKFSGAPRNKGGYSYRRKQFDIGKKHFKCFEIPAQQIEDYVWSKVLQAMKEPEVFIEHYLSMEHADPSTVEKLNAELNTLREREVNIELEMARIEGAFETGAYSEEKMIAKISEKQKEMGKVAEGIQTKVDRINLMTSVDIEVQKLKEASKQVKYRLDMLDIKQKKILCNLFIDRVEMRRKKMPSDTKRDKWRVSATIFFRFNPEKFSEDALRGRTSSIVKKATKKALKSEKVIDGGRWKT